MWGGAVSARRAVLRIHSAQRTVECQCSTVCGGHAVLQPSHSAASHAGQGFHIPLSRRPFFAYIMLSMNVTRMHCHRGGQRYALFCAIKAAIGRICSPCWDRSCCRKERSCCTHMDFAFILFISERKVSLDSYVLQDVCAAHFAFLCSEIYPSVPSSPHTAG